MELSQEHFDNQLAELHKRLDNMATNAELESIRAEMVTKADLTTALENQTKEFEHYTDSVAATILEAVDNGFKTSEKGQISRDKKLEVVEKDTWQLKKALHLL